MSRLIDVDELKADLRMADDCKDCKTNAQDCEYDRVYTKMDFCAWLDDAPTVDAVPVKHGKWIDLGKDRMIRWQCSECGRKDMHIFNFCPDCGAALS